ncbi:MAG: hypothetical protein F6K10_19370 [Moorea sp. SIO2B7]|nr:hypothetical protein [Moorena sp. SIO2B7]
MKVAEDLGYSFTTEELKAVVQEHSQGVKVMAVISQLDLNWGLGIGDWGLGTGELRAKPHL